MAASEHTADDTTRVADEPEPGYFQPLRQQPETADDPKCNCGAKPGCAAAECEECRPHGYGDAGRKCPDGLTREYLAKWYTMFWKRADEIKAMIDASPAAKDLPYKIGYGSDRLIKALIERLTAAEQRAEAAERQLATERSRHANICAEFEKIAKGEHPLYVMRCEVESQLAQLQSDNNRLNSMLKRTGYGQGQIDAHMDIEEENEKLKAEVAQLKQQAEEQAWQLAFVLNRAANELNCIRARNGVPYNSDGTRSDVSEEYFSSIIDDAEEALEASGLKFVPWDLKRKAASQADQKGDG